MSESREEWSDSQKIAYPYIRRAVEEGLTATAALREYRDGGGHIGNEYWYDLYRDQFQHQGWRETIVEIPSTYTITDKMFRRVDWDLREKYAVMMKVRGYSSEIDRYITKWVTVESERPLTKGEYKGMAQQAISDTIGSPDLEVEDVLEWDAVMR